MSIGRLRPVIWPPFSWRAVKDKCYANHPETIEALKHEIKVAVHGIEAQTIEKCTKKFGWSNGVL